MTTNEALIERLRIEADAIDAYSYSAAAIMLNAADAIEALTPPAAEGDVTQAAFTEGLWAGWRSGLAGEQMDDVYAAKSWSASDASAHLAHAAPKVAGVEKAALREIADMTKKQQLPITAQIHEIAKAALAAAPSAPGSGEG